MAKVWAISTAEPTRPPTRDQWWDNTLTQITAGPDDDAPLYCLIVRRTEYAETMARLTAPPLLDLAAAPAYVRLLDAPETAPSVAGEGCRSAARPAAPNAPPPSSRSVSRGRTLVAI